MDSKCLILQMYIRYFWIPFYLFISLLPKSLQSILAYVPPLMSLAFSSCAFLNPRLRKSDVGKPQNSKAIAPESHSQVTANLAAWRKVTVPWCLSHSSHLAVTVSCHPVLITATDRQSYCSNYWWGVPTLALHNAAAGQARPTSPDLARKPLCVTLGRKPQRASSCIEKDDSGQIQGATMAQMEGWATW